MTRDTMGQSFRRHYQIEDRKKSKSNSQLGKMTPLLPNVLLFWCEIRVVDFKIEQRRKCCAFIAGYRHEKRYYTGPEFLSTLSARRQKESH
ncbi:hypothetical protein CEXT_115421 [Caerostris extrusa]|uniref:Uncharacterized protein n=1 Tax=Caerostris extrusa TaxID=172846 RepID=A0AAV4MVK3_CAEEX|nr:hypothetical protein CEXT_115421 [Caerostris extrusa]